MRLVGLILLILGILGGIKSFTRKPPQNASAAYQTGYRAGGVIGTLLFTGAGLWLLLRDGSGSMRSGRARPRRANQLPPRAPLPPPVPLQMPVKIHCNCGQNYSFEIEPVAGRMPSPVTCPSCGADGTEAANTVIAQTLATRLRASTQPQPVTVAARRLHPALIVVMTMAGMLAILVAFSVLRKFGTRYRVREAHSGLPPSWTPPDPSRPARDRVTRPTVAPPPHARIGTNRPQPGRVGSVTEAAPVPSNITAVEVHWGNAWWPATVLKREGPRAYIHYEGWSSTSDEWVTPERLRPRN